METPSINEHFVTITATTTHTYRIELPGDVSAFEQIDAARKEAQKRWNAGEEPNSRRYKVGSPRWEFASGNRG